MSGFVFCFALLLIGCKEHCVAGRSFWAPMQEAVPLTASELGWGVPPNVTENTVEAFRRGLALGASAVEVTARLTRDGKIALHHDVVAKNGRVVPLSNFDQLPDGTLELATYLKVCGGVGMNIMLQNNGFVFGTVPEVGYDPTNKVADVVVQRVLDAGLQDSVLLSAFNIETVARAAAVCNGCGIRTAWLQVSAQTMKALHAPPWLVPNFTSAQYLDEVTKNGLNAFNPENLMVDRAMLSAAQDRDIQLFVWWLGIHTSSEESLVRMQQLSDCGLTGFITPRVKMGLDAKKAKHPKYGKACDPIFAKSTPEETLMPDITV